MNYLMNIQQNLYKMLYEILHSDYSRLVYVSNIMNTSCNLLFLHIHFLHFESVSSSVSFKKIFRKKNSRRVRQQITKLSKSNDVRDNLDFKNFQKKRLLTRNCKNKTLKFNFGRREKKSLKEKPDRIFTLFRFNLGLISCQRFLNAIQHRSKNAIESILSRNQLVLTVLFSYKKEIAWVSTSLFFFFQFSFNFHTAIFI